MTFSQKYEELLLEEELLDDVPETPQKLKPFLKWAGGKIRILPELKKRFPPGKRFIEPFLGAGSVSLNVDYPVYIVNDINQDLMSVWKYLQRDGMEFIRKAQCYFFHNSNNKEYFERKRKVFNGEIECPSGIPFTDYVKATLFIYLNRHCFNGLCRYNNKGKFNSPFGKYKDPVYFPREEMEKSLVRVNKFEIHNYLKNIIQLCSEVNKYVNDSAPWSLKEDNLEKSDKLLEDWRK